MYILEPKNEINAVDFSLEGDRFATAGKDFSVRLYDTDTNEVSLPMYTYFFIDY